MEQDKTKGTGTVMFLCRSKFCSYEYKITWLKVFVSCFTVNALDLTGKECDDSRMTGPNQIYESF